MTDEAPPIRAAERISDHWWDRPGWKPGRLFDGWYLVFGDSNEVRDIAARCRAALRALPGLDPVPDEWLHMTIQGVDWSDKLTDADRKAVIRSATEELYGLGELAIQLGPPLVKGEALVLAATPTEGLHELHSRLRTAISTALGRPAPVASEQSGGFLPHVSIAYAHIDADAAPYASALGSVSPATAQVTVRQAAFIRQERQLAPHWRYRWDELARIPLAGSMANRRRSD